MKMQDMKLTDQFTGHLQGMKLQDMQRQSRQEAQLLLGDRATRKHAKDS